MFYVLCFMFCVLCLFVCVCVGYAFSHFFGFRRYINTLIGGFLSVCVCVCVGYAFSHFSDFDDATALLRYQPTRMHPPTASTPFFVFFSIVHQYSNWRFSVCLSVCGERFFAFFGFRRYINTLIGGFPCVCVS